AFVRATRHQRWPCVGHSTPQGFDSESTAAAFLEAPMSSFPDSRLPYSCTAASGMAAQATIYHQRIELLFGERNLPRTRHETPEYVSSWRPKAGVSLSCGSMRLMRRPGARPSVSRESSRLSERVEDSTADDLAELRRNGIPNLNEGGSKAPKEHVGIREGLEPGRFAWRDAARQIEVDEAV